MSKIPVTATATGAYRFLFTQIISIVGTIWLPLVVMVALMGGLVYAVVPHAWWSGGFPPSNDPRVFMAAFAPILSIYPLIVLIGLVMVSMMFAGLMRHALGQKKTTTFVYFSLVAPVWRLAVAWFLAEILIIVLLVVLIGIFCAAWLYAMPPLPHPPHPTNGLFWFNYPAWLQLSCHIAHNCQSVIPKGPQIAGLIVLGLVEICVFFYAAVRLTFFLPAVVVAEGRIGLGRAWSLGGGNFWRIFALFLMTYIPVAILFGMVSHFTIDPVVQAGVAKIPHLDSPGQAVAVMFHAQLSLWPLILAIALLQRVALMGLITGTIGFAYNAVTEPKDKASA